MADTPKTTAPQTPTTMTPEVLAQARESTTKLVDAMHARGMISEAAHNAVRDALDSDNVQHQEAVLLAIMHAMGSASPDADLDRVTKFIDSQAEASAPSAFAGESAVKTAYANLRTRLNELSLEESSAAKEVAADPNDAGKMAALLDIQAQVKQLSEQRNALDVAMASAQAARDVELAKLRKTKVANGRTKAMLFAQRRVDAADDIDKALDALDVAVRRFVSLSDKACQQHSHAAEAVMRHLITGNRFDVSRGQIDAGGGVIVPSIAQRLADILRPLQIHGCIQLQGFVSGPGGTAYRVRTAAAHASAHYEQHSSTMLKWAEEPPPAPAHLINEHIVARAEKLAPLPPASMSPPIEYLYVRAAPSEAA